ncbi:hypothetical protein BGZ60DRAFT_122572 [Tricladium varicosporioides]|nr:hypothetical protein BGZ60DRAFT_122572 [Hymenoscyphus varicosporioides]
MAHHSSRDQHDDSWIVATHSLLTIPHSHAISTCQVDQKLQAIDVRSGPPLRIRGTDIYITRRIVHILMNIEVDWTTFANMFRADGHIWTVAVNIWKRFIGTVTNIFTEIVGPQYKDSSFALVSPARAWVIAMLSEEVNMPAPLQYTWTETSNVKN